MIDSKDKKILDILSASGREPATSISTKIGMSVPAVIDRINKLQDSGIIMGYKAIVDYEKLDMDIAALITLVSDSSEHYSKVINLAKKSKEVIKCFATTGSGSHVLLINTENTDSHWEILPLCNLKIFYLLPVSPLVFPVQSLMMRVVVH